MVTAIVATVGTAVLTELTTKAINGASSLVKDISNWDSARQDFTKATVKSMMDNNKDAAYVAAACYNKGYRVTNPENVDGKTSVSFKSGALHTNYDCMYLKAPNTFYTDGDNGFMAMIVVVCGLAGAVTITIYKWGFFVLGLMALFYVWSV